MTINEAVKMLSRANIPNDIRKAVNLLTDKVKSDNHRIAMQENKLALMSRTRETMADKTVVFLEAKGIVVGEDFANELKTYLKK